MAKSINKQTSQLLIALAYLIIGVLFIVFKSGIVGLVLEIALTILGVLFIVKGILDIVNNKKTTEGIIQIVIGAVIIVLGWTIVEIILLVLGVLIVIKGVLDLINASNTKKLTPIIYAVITIVVGVLLVIGKFASAADILFIIIGVVFVLDAIFIGISALSKK